MNIIDNEKPVGVVVQMGGQTPLNLAVPLVKAGVNVLGTSSDSIDIAEDRKRCRELLDQIGLKQPESAAVMSVDEGILAARKIGYPIMIRPSYVLGGRAMMISRNENDAGPFIEAAFAASPGFPVLIDRYLERATEIDVDVLCDGKDVYIGGVMEQIEVAGIHSGDSACCTPPHTLSKKIVVGLKEAARKIALALNVRGLMNVQMAVQKGEIYIIEINPRASRTVPYVSKATGVQLAKMAARISMGQTLAELGLVGKEPEVAWAAVKEAVLPFNRFPGVDPIVGPEMKSTGEVMGIDMNFETAYWKSQIAAGQRLPSDGTVFLSARDADKKWMVKVGQTFAEIGFNIVATGGTAKALQAAGVQATVLQKLIDQTGTNVIDLMKKGGVQLVVNTPSGVIARADEVRIRTEAISRSIPIITTEDGAFATVAAIKYVKEHGWDVRAIQDYHA